MSILLVRANMLNFFVEAPVLQIQDYSSNRPETQNQQSRKREKKGSCEFGPILLLSVLNEPDVQLERVELDISVALGIDAKIRGAALSLSKINMVSEACHPRSGSARRVSSVRIADSPKGFSFSACSCHGSLLQSLRSSFNTSSP